MIAVDYVVLVGYFILMAVIGVVCMLRIRRQEDFFLGGRAFGKIMQSFAAFGAGTGANDPVTIGRTTYTSGLSGIWGVLLWLFVTPFYWIVAVWFRRMRHLTLGDWFVERYDSKGMGVAYTVFAIYFYMVYLSVGFSSVGKVCAPLIGADTFDLPVFGVTEIQYVLVPIIALVVVIYGVLGGLQAAYWTDLIQGLFIILLSIILIPYGLDALVDRFGSGGDAASLTDGFSIMHERVAEEKFQILGSPRGSEFPLYYILAITLINLIGVVVQPHFIATGGGSAKTETAARFGLVAGNLMKRFCTVGWALTTLIVLALLADNAEIASDPDRVWGVAAREILGPLGIGLVGLMLACLLAALMSSADCYMLMVSGLVVRNVYVAYVKPEASDRECVRLGRIVGFVTILGGAVLSMSSWDVFGQLKLTWELPVIFAACFWVGMYWRRATKLAAWATVITSALVFFILPIVLPGVLSDLRTDPRYAVTNDLTTTIVTRKAFPVDVAKRQVEIGLWESRGDERGPRPESIREGEDFQDIFKSGGKAIFWWGGVQPVGGGAGKRREVSRETEGNRTTIHEVYDCALEGKGHFSLVYLLYKPFGVDLTKLSSPMLETLRLPPKIVLPFVFLILLSLVTPRVRRDRLDRYYVKMKTPVEKDPGADRRELELSYEDPGRFDDRKLFPSSEFEIQRPRFIDTVGFVLSFVACFLIIALIIWIAGIGA